jgi:hypothetical protein
MRNQRELPPAEEKTMFVNGFFQIKNDYFGNVGVSKGNAFGTRPVFPELLVKMAIFQQSTVAPLHRPAGGLSELTVPNQLKP